MSDKKTPEYYPRQQLPRVYSAGKEFERTIFNYFKKYLGSDWMFYHEFDLEDTEFDFLLVNLNTGITLNLEVKATNVFGLPDNPHAKYYDYDKDINHQVSRAGRLFLQYYKDEFGKPLIKPTPFLYTLGEKAHGVLPNTEPRGKYLVHSGEHYPYQLDDLIEKINNFNPEGIDKLYDDQIRNVRTWFKKKESERKSALAEDIANFCDLSGEQLKTVLNHNYKGSVLVQGLAGTGKTELLKARLYDLENKDRPLLICYNDLLVERLKDDLSNHQNLKIIGIHQLIREIAGDHFTEEEADSSLPQNERQKIISELHDMNFEEAKKSLEAYQRSNDYSHIFIDEGQDLLVRELELLKDLCGDKPFWFNFDDSQAYRSDTASLEDVMSILSFDDKLELTVALRSPKDIRNNITSNCKNRVDKSKFRLSEIDFSGKVIEKKIKKDKLASELKESVNSILFDEVHGFATGDVGVLTAQSNNRISGIQEGAWLTRDQVAEFCDCHYDTIYRSKGLEFPAVILIINQDHRNFEFLRYLGSTRALGYLKILVVED